MRKQGILNVELCAAIAEIGHTDCLVIADPGLPIPAGVKVIDLSLLPGLPPFCDVLRAVADELVVERCIIASEMAQVSAGLRGKALPILGAIPVEEVSHEQFKQLTGKAKVLVRTGECTPFANIILVGGAGF